ncbi:DUF2959 domain-containing protein [Aliikangiella sp. G2MR2-5]|uniref:DUF2959 domain-containing protein n=1 Tax=Aliikangiella sp. G2MR2-5 TaxID=2788943 RepID=UPI0018A8F992|nr:DUF2959 domain-containing protein [Aliikangiella sp. G2MR2-5]
MNKRNQAVFLSIILFTTLLSGCQSAYYGALEKVGIHKRDVLVSRVEKTRDSQEEAKEQFQSALEQFKSVVHFDGGELESVYNKLNDEYIAAKEAAEDVTNRIDNVESVSDALFDEWEAELSEYTSASLKRQSQQSLTETKRQYARMIKTMRRVEKSMQPVLNVFKDQVLFLKHNLNAKAVSSIKNELKGIETDVSRLIQQMNDSIKEANDFIKSME